jgi:hypothetical protein
MVTINLGWTGGAWFLYLNVDFKRKKRRPRTSLVHYVVERGGIEPPSEKPTSSVLHA